MSINVSKTGGLRKAKKQIDAQRGAQSFTKVLELNNEYSVFIPATIDEDGLVDIATATAVGRSCDYDATNIGFTKITAIEEDESGKLTDLSGLNNYYKLANTFYKAAYKKEAIRKREELEVMFKKTGRVDELALATALKEIEVAYFGVKADKVTSAKLPTKKRLISGLQTRVVTEGVIYKLSKELTIDSKDPKVVSIDLSKKRLEAIIAVLDNPNYTKHVKEYGFIELKFSYLGADKQSAGQNATFSGVEEGVSKLPKQPDELKEVLAAIKTVAADDMSIAARNIGISRAATAESAKQAIEKYIATNLDLLEYIDYEEEELKYNAKALLGFENVFYPGSEYANKLSALITDDVNETEMKDAQEILGKLKDIKEDSSSREVLEAVAATEAKLEEEGDIVTDID